MLTPLLLFCFVIGVFSGCDSTGNVKCSSGYQDCCPGLNCYEKNQWWAACKSTCDPNWVDPYDNQKWSCNALCTTKSDYDVVGSDLASKNVKSAAECCNFCKTVPGCNAAALFNNVCYAKSGSATTSKTGVIAVLKSVGATPPVPLPTQAPTPVKVIGKVLVSGYNSQIALYSLGSDKLTNFKYCPVDPNLTWLQQAGGSFYAIHEVSTFNGVNGGAVSRWEMVNDCLVRREYTGLQSVGPAHLLVDLDHGLAFSANYGGGSVTVISLANGKLGPVVQLLQYGQGCRDKSHPHQVVRLGNIVFIMDLGCDSIYSYKINGNQLALLGKTSVEAGAGPRHMAIKGEQAFVVCELKNYVLNFKIDTINGNLVLLQTLPLLNNPTGGYNAGGEILVSGNYVYVSSRGTGVVSVFGLAGTQLVKIQEQKLSGTWPRSMAIKSDYLLVEDQKGNSVQTLYVDRATGKVTPGGLQGTPQEPAFVMFYD